MKKHVEFNRVGFKIDTKNLGKINTIFILLNFGILICHFQKVLNETINFKGFVNLRISQYKQQPKFFLTNTHPAFCSCKEKGQIRIETCIKIHSEVMPNLYKLALCYRYLYLQRLNAASPSSKAVFRQTAKKLELDSICKILFLF